MTRLLSTTVLSVMLLGGGAFAQEAADRPDAQEAKREQTSNSICAEIDRNPSRRTHALVELCNWVGQYR